MIWWQSEPRAIDPEERAFVRMLADLVAQALERADLLDRLRHANDRFARAEKAAAPSATSGTWRPGWWSAARTPPASSVTSRTRWEDLAALIHPDDPRMTREDAIALLASSPEPTIEAESRARHKDGSWRWSARVAPTWTRAACAGGR